MKGFLLLPLFLFAPGHNYKPIKRLSAGGLYRFGVAVKELGELAGHKRKWWAGAAIAFGLALRGLAGRFPAKERR